MLPKALNPDDLQNSELLVLNTFLDDLNRLKGKINENNYQDAFQVINCLRFIKVNKEYIQYAIDRKEFTCQEDKEKGVLRDHKGTAFHISTYFESDSKRASSSNDKYMTQAQLKASGFPSFGEYGYYCLMTEYVTMVENAYTYLKQSKESSKLLQFISLLQNNKDTGCMEHRLAKALDFIRKDKEFDGRFSIDSLFQLAYNIAETKEITKDSVEYVRLIFSYMQPFIEKKTECYDGERHVVTLTEEVVIDYLKNVLFFEDNEISEGFEAYKKSPIEIKLDTQPIQTDNPASISVGELLLDISLLPEELEHITVTKNSESHKITCSDQNSFERMRYYLSSLQDIQSDATQRTITISNSFDLVKSWLTSAAMKIVSSNTPNVGTSSVDYSPRYNSFGILFRTRNEALNFSYYIKDHFGMSSLSRPNEAKRTLPKAGGFAVLLSQDELPTFFLHFIRNERNCYSLKQIHEENCYFLEQIDALANQFQIKSTSSFFTLFSSSQQRAETKLVAFLRSLPKDVNESNSLSDIIAANMLTINNLFGDVRRDLKEVLSMLLSPYQIARSDIGLSRN